MPHLESKTKLIMTASVNKYINPFFFNNTSAQITERYKLIQNPRVRQQGSLKTA